MLRRIIPNLHVYGGLLCFSYLLLLGISVLNFNHAYSFTSSSGNSTTWTQPMAVDLAKTDGMSSTEALQFRRRNNQNILHALGSFAVTSPNDGNWTAADTYHAHFGRIGKEYQIDVHPSQRSATITQTRANFWALIRDLHGAYAVYPDSLLGSTWAWYTNLCTCVVIVAGISGIYLWTGRRRERRAGLIVFAVAAAISISLMILITLRD